MKWQDIVAAVTKVAIERGEDPADFNPEIDYIDISASDDGHWEVTIDKFGMSIHV